MKKVLCSKISVDCIKNDIVDIRCGGPVFLGFDFFVKKDEVDSMIIFIAETLKEFDVPYINISPTKDVMIERNKVFTKKAIVACIKREAPTLKEEASIRLKSGLKAE